MAKTEAEAVAKANAAAKAKAKANGNNNHNHNNCQRARAMAAPPMPSLKRQSATPFWSKILSLLQQWQHFECKQLLAKQRSIKNNNNNK